MAGRIKHHLEPSKKPRWHIDYLLRHEDAKVLSVVASETTKEKECEINQFLMRCQKAKMVVKGFGSTDCRHGCKTHLLYFGNPNLDTIVGVTLQTYRQANLKPRLLKT